MNDNHPLEEIRLKAGLSKLAWAEALGVSFMLVQQVSAGVIARPMKMIRALEGMGYDGAELLGRYIAWREKNQESIGKRLAAAK